MKRNDKQSDVCYYFLETPYGLFEQGKILLNFKRAQNIDIYLYRTDRDNFDIN